MVDEAYRAFEGDLGGSAEVCRRLRDGQHDGAQLDAAAQIPAGEARS